MKPHVLMMATCASSASLTSRYPAPARAASMISESTVFLAQPKDMSAALGASDPKGTGASRRTRGISEMGWI